MLLLASLVLAIPIAYVSAELQCTVLDGLTLVVNDTANIGDAIHDFGESFSLATGCTDFTANGTKLLLNHKLRQPCTVVNTLNCQVLCQPHISHLLVVPIQKVDVYLPSFPRSIYLANVTELSAVGKVVLEFDDSDETRATDEDCGAIINYEIADSDGGNFTIFGSLGRVTTNGSVLYDDRKSYTLVIHAGNHDRYGNTTLVISVLDSDDKNPTFSHTTYNLNIIEEHVASEDLPTTPPVQCYDQDVGIDTPVQYAFKGMETTNSYFSINSTTGELKQTTKIDREKIRIWRAEIMCYQANDVTKTATAFLEVAVIDVNDHLPTFAPEYLYMNVSVTEQSTGAVATVHATDQDEGDNAVIFYELVQGVDAFGVDRDMGVISVKSPSLLDRETMENFTILVRAVDMAGNSSVNNATVVVNLLDLNDNSPEFEQDRYSFVFNVSVPASIIGTIFARDSDVPGTPNSNVTYEFISTWTVGTPAPGPFSLSIDLVSGEISISNTVLPEVEYYMIVRACDNPVNENERRCSSVQAVAVYSVNKTDSVDVSFNVSVNENVPPGTIIGQQLPLAGSRYTLSTTDFAVDHASHMLITNTALDRETQDTYRFTVSVISHTDLEVGNISVSLSVLDVNDHRPVFSLQDYYFRLPLQDGGQDVVLGNLQSEDKDIGENENRSYTLQSSPVSGWFSLDPRSGRLTLSRQWAGAGYKQSLFILVARVADHGTPSLQSTAQVFVSTMENVDNSSVVIYTSASASFIKQEKERLQGDMATVLGVDHITIDEMTDVTSQLLSTRSRIHVRASYKNGTDVPFDTLARLMMEHWYSVQDLFRSPLTGQVEHTDTSLRATEIALIVVACAILVGTLIAIPVVCRQWKSYVRDHRLYDSLRRPSTMYDSQELNLNFTAEDRVSRGQLSSFRTTPRKEEEESVFDSSFGLAYVSPVFVGDDDTAPKTPTWGSSIQPRIPRWSTTDSLKDAIESLEDLSNRLNAEDSISAVTELSRTRSMKSQNSFKGTGSDRLRDWDTADDGEEPEVVTENDDRDTPDPDYPGNGAGDLTDEGQASDRDRILMDNGSVRESNTAEKPGEIFIVSANAVGYSIEESTKF